MRRLFKVGLVALALSCAVACGDSDENAAAVEAVCEALCGSADQCAGVYPDCIPQCVSDTYAADKDYTKCPINQAALSQCIADIWARSCSQTSNTSADYNPPSCVASKVCAPVGGGGGLG